MLWQTLLELQTYIDTYVSIRYMAYFPTLLYSVVSQIVKTISIILASSCHFSLSILAAFFQQIIEKIYITFTSLSLPLCTSPSLSVSPCVQRYFFIKQPLPLFGTQFLCKHLPHTLAFLFLPAPHLFPTLSHNWQFSQFSDLKQCNTLLLSLFLAISLSLSESWMWVCDAESHKNTNKVKTSKKSLT